MSLMPEFDTVDLHLITERADGPDLDDLVDLIRYLREHGITYDHAGVGGGGSWGYSMQIRWYPKIDTVPSGYRPPSVSEGSPLPEAHYVGPDGTVYDNERNPL